MFMTRHLQLRAITISCTLAGIAACGGGGGGEAPTIPAVTVLGQASFQANQSNQGGAVADNTLDNPIGNVTLSESGTLFVPDTLNGRVLGYRKVPEQNNAPADFVIGKLNLFAPTSGTVSKTDFNSPYSVSIAKGKMAVADRFANRVLIYSEVPSSNAQPATFVVGQSSPTAQDSLGCSRVGLSAPRSAVLTPNGKLVLADLEHHRVLIWNNVPQADLQPADAVVGQPDFTSCAANAGAAGPGAETLNEPDALWSDGEKLIVADSLNHRVLIWNRMPADSAERFKPADVVLGQISFSGSAPNDAGGDGIKDAAPGASTFNTPRAVHSDGVRLAVGDTGNHRVLIWNTIPTSSGTPPDRVIGQADSGHGAPNDGNRDGAEDPTPTEAVFKAPRGVYLDGQRLFVSDTMNHRVLIIRLDR
ncbi:hypothetical protein EZ313_10665 [Ramlibacter henchirensis]|uniref:NHL repeat containing protein n=1 Tax=Ramlibacter henchirensis TaxID=204072 RepID=A0A4Z0C6Y6_9BURK|nr:hypothetical protein [Ramlibacter henchirensis]TFZ07051.1 hypothetical protein EZ313_10665 [Ramlibacter henchirensis]